MSENTFDDECAGSGGAIVAASSASYAQFEVDVRKSAHLAGGSQFWLAGGLSPTILGIVDSDNGNGLSRTSTHTFSADVSGGVFAAKSRHDSGFAYYEYVFFADCKFFESGCRTNIGAACAVVSTRAVVEFEHRAHGPTYAVVGLYDSGRAGCGAAAASCASESEIFD